MKDVFLNNIKKFFILFFPMIYFIFLAILTMLNILSEDILKANIVLVNPILFFLQGVLSNWSYLYFLFGVLISIVSYLLFNILYLDNSLIRYLDVYVWSIFIGYILRQIVTSRLRD